MIHSALEHCEPLDLMERNLRAMGNLLELAHRCGVGRVLFTSSGAVYGPQPPDLERLDEDYHGAPPLGPDGAYGEVKRASELLGLLSGERHGFDFLIARCFSFLGSWLPLAGSRAAGNFIANALAGQPIKVSGDGRAWRSYLHGEDLANWLWTILLQGKHGRPYNVGSDQPIQIADLAGRTRDLLAPEVDVQIALEPGTGPAPRYVPSTERARLELGLSARVGLDEAILRTARWNRGTGRAW
jgi:dTDP-glucose 4,6-dehydratase